MERYHRQTPLKVLKSMWLAIRESNGQEIEHTRLVKQLQKIFTSAGDQIESYVTNAVVDNLIQVVDNPKRPKPKSVYHYTLPDITDFSFPEEHPDFYCYECHLEGNVQKCTDCLRVFHRECVKTLTEKHAKLEEYVTNYKRVNISDFGLVAFSAPTVANVVTPPVDANENHTAPSDEVPAAKLLLRRPISMDTIQQKIEDSKYERLEQFCADILDIAHNIGIIHGATSLEYNAVMYFVTDCIYDLFEIRQCPDCFRHSNEKAEPDWFARPCNTRHELVFAKHKGYQYWPAKVIRVVNNKYDVRFFGDKHSRAVVDTAFVKPIDSDLVQLKINPKKPGFQKSMEELHKH
ncbi:AAEL005716-PA, partial [Aedes aegypti]